jgi:hypothetical protein
MCFEEGGLTHCVKQLVVLDIALHALVEDFPGEDATFTALGSQPQFLANLAKPGRAIFHRFADLAIGDGFAETNIHS